jgi:hypothetical protein
VTFPGAAGERVPLETFLAGLDENPAAEARVAAAEIDRLALVGDRMEGIERRYLPWGLSAAALFVVGLWLLVDPRIAPGWLPLALLLSALPAVGLHYASAVGPRTRADRAAEKLNRAHFLPHGGLYFPPGERPAAVVRVRWTPPEPEPPISEAPRDPRKKREYRPGRIW